MLRRHIWTILSALAAIIALAPACSSNSTSPAPSSTGSAASVAPQVHGAYERCLASHGVPASPPNGPAPQGPPPGPPPPGGTPAPPPGIDQTTWNNAISACKSLAPSPPAGNR